MSELDAALAEVARTETLLVALDFDGTLSPLVDEPLAARALPEAQQAVRDLCALPHTRVALISGRALDSLMQVAQVPDAVLLSGSHGIEERFDAPPALTLSPDELGRVAALRSALDDAITGLPEVWIETKPAGFAVHTRLATPTDRAAAEERSRHAVASLPGLTERVGSNVVEFSVRSTTKGDAVTRLRELTGATAVVFAGDDVTDEDAFAVLGAHDVGIKCGPGDTRASHRVDSPAEVAGALAELARVRATR